MSGDNEFESKGCISTMHHCETINASELCLFDIGYKIKTGKVYDIGGIYSKDDPDLWFYYTTSVCHGNLYLLNLFVLPRRPLCFSLSLPSSTQLGIPVKDGNTKTVAITDKLVPQTFVATHPDEDIYIKTLQFDADQVNLIEGCTLHIPIKVTLHNKPQLDKNVANKIKLNHDFSKLRLKKESADFTLLSKTKKKYLVHKVLIAAHSEVVRDLIFKGEDSLVLDVSEDVMEILIDFLYTGAIDNMSKNRQETLVLLEIADKIKMTQLFALTQILLADQVTVQNAIEIAVLADRYKLETLTSRVFNFINTNPKVLETEHWHTLTNINLIKSLLKFIHPHRGVKS